MQFYFSSSSLDQQFSSKKRDLLLLFISLPVLCCQLFKPLASLVRKHFFEQKQFLTKYVHECSMFMLNCSIPLLGAFEKQDTIFETSVCCWWFPRNRIYTSAWCLDHTPPTSYPAPWPHHPPTLLSRLQYCEVRNDMFHLEVWVCCLHLWPLLVWKPEEARQGSLWCIGVFHPLHFLLFCHLLKRVWRQWKKGKQCDILLVVTTCCVSISTFLLSSSAIWLNHNFSLVKSRDNWTQQWI